MKYFFVVISGFIIDQLIKVFILDRYQVGESSEVIENFFYITHVRNPGAAWGLLGEYPQVLMVLTLVALVVLGLIFYKMKDAKLRLLISVVLSGAAGNIFDRIFRGEVVDYLDFRFGSYVYPTFNLADTLVVCGTFLMTFYILKIEKSKEEIPVE